jgi:hypothetical protein
MAARRSNTPQQGHIRVVIESNTSQQGPLRVVINNMEAFDDDGGSELARILEQLAFSAATLISAEADDLEQTNRIIDGFQALVRDNTWRMADSRRNGARN